MSIFLTISTLIWLSSSREKYAKGADSYANVKKIPDWKDVNKGFAKEMERKYRVVKIENNGMKKSGT